MWAEDYRLTPWHDARRERRELNVDSVQVPLRGTLKVALLFIPSALLHFASAFSRPVGSGVFGCRSVGDVGCHSEQCCCGQLEHVERSFPTKSEQVNKGFQELNRSAPPSIKNGTFVEGLERCTRPCSRHRWAGWETRTMRFCIYLHGTFCLNPG